VLAVPLALLVSVIVTDVLSVEENEFVTALVPSAMASAEVSVRLKVEEDDDESATEIAAVSVPETVTAIVEDSTIPTPQPSVPGILLNGLEDSVMLMAAVSAVLIDTADTELVSVTESADVSLPTIATSTPDVSETEIADVSEVLSVTDTDLLSATLTDAESDVFEVPELALLSEALIAAVSDALTFVVEPIMSTCPAGPPPATRSRPIRPEKSVPAIVADMTTEDAPAAS
jgi:hypothetical protein